MDDLNRSNLVIKLASLIYKNLKASGFPRLTALLMKAMSKYVYITLREDSSGERSVIVKDATIGVINGCIWITFLENVPVTKINEFLPRQFQLQVAVEELIGMLEEIDPYPVYSFEISRNGDDSSNYDAELCLSTDTFNVEERDELKEEMDAAI